MYAGRVDESAPEMGSEDFSYMLEKRPGALMWPGNGDSAALHNPGYDFNDSAILPGRAIGWNRCASACRAEAAGTGPAAMGRAAAMRFPMPCPAGHLCPCLAVLYGF